MNWEAAGALGEIIGAVAVIATLWYLARQIRLSAQSTRFLATQSMVTNQAAANFLIAENDELAAFGQATSEPGGFEALLPHQQMRFGTLMMGFYLQIDFAYHQYQNGLLEEKMWKRMEEDIPKFLIHPGQMVWWSRDKHRFTPEFVVFVDKLLADYERPEELPTMGRPNNGHPPNKSLETDA